MKTHMSISNVLEVNFTGKFQSAKILFHPLAKEYGIKSGITTKVGLRLRVITDIMAKQLGSIRGLHNSGVVTEALQTINTREQNQ